MHSSGGLFQFQHLLILCHSNNSLKTLEQISHAFRIMHALLSAQVRRVSLFTFGKYSERQYRHAFGHHSSRFFNKFFVLTIEWLSQLQEIRKSMREDTCQKDLGQCKDYNRLRNGLTLVLTHIINITINDGSDPPNNTRVEGKHYR